MGFVARAWIAETFKWVMDNVPKPHLDRLLGLMLGYSPDAIAVNDEGLAGEQFPDTATALNECAPIALAHVEEDRHTEGMSPLGSMRSDSDGCIETHISPIVDKSDQ